jgi:hypothetical protein
VSSVRKPLQASKWRFDSIGERRHQNTLPLSPPAALFALETRTTNGRTEKSAIDVVARLVCLLIDAHLFVWRATAKFPGLGRLPRVLFSRFDCFAATQQRPMGRVEAQLSRRTKFRSRFDELELGSLEETWRKLETATAAQGLEKWNFLVALVWGAIGWQFGVVFACLSPELRRAP